MIPPSHRNSGFALITSLMLLASVTLLVVAYFSLSKDEMRNARHFSEIHHARLACTAGFEEAKNLLLGTTATDEYFITSIPNRSTITETNSTLPGWADNDGDPDSGDDDDGDDPNNWRSRNEGLNIYYFLSRFTGQAGGGAVEHLPLFSGGKIHETSIWEGPTYQVDETLEKANGVIQGLREIGLEEDDDTTNNYDEDGRQGKWRAYTRWLRPDLGGEAGRIRYTYWVEDMQAFVQPDRMGNTANIKLYGYDPSTYRSGSDSDHVATDLYEQNGPQERANQNGLYDQAVYGYGFRDPRVGIDENDLEGGTPWNPAVPGDPGVDVSERLRVIHSPSSRTRPSRYGFKFPYRVGSDPGFQYQVNQVAPGLSSREYVITLRTGGSAHGHRERILGRSGAIMSSASAGLIASNKENNASYGVRPYMERPIIPSAPDFGYGSASGHGPGRPRMNLNRELTEALSAGASEAAKAAAVTDLATDLNSLLPDWRWRGGGLEMAADDWLAPVGRGDHLLPFHDPTNPKEGDIQQSYLKTIVANMIDYADFDFEPTKGDRASRGKEEANWVNSTNYRGIDNYPVVNEHWLLFEWLDTRIFRGGVEVTDQVGANGEVATSGNYDFRVRMRMTPFLEFWNQTNQPFPSYSSSGTSSHLGLIYWQDGESLLNQYRIQLGGQGGRRADTTRTDSDASAARFYAAAIQRYQGETLDGILRPTNGLTDYIAWRNVELAPNQHRAYRFDSVVWEAAVHRVRATDDGSGQLKIILPTQLTLRSLSRSGGGETYGANTRYRVLLRGAGADLGDESERHDQLLHTLLDESAGLLNRPAGNNALMEWDFPWKDNITAGRTLRHLYIGGDSAHLVKNHADGTGGIRINPGDPLISYHLQGPHYYAPTDGFADANSLGGRNYRRGSVEWGGRLFDGTNSNEDVQDAGSSLSKYDTSNDLTAREVRPEWWPDKGYNGVRGRHFSDEVAETATAGSLGGLLVGLDPSTDEVPIIPGPTGFTDGFTVPEPDASNIDGPSLAPIRLSNRGRFFSIAELGHIYDPILWWEGNSLRNWNEWARIEHDGYAGRIKDPRRGGGNTLRIGRAEHYPFRGHQVGTNVTSHDDLVGDEGLPISSRMHAARLLDVLHVGVNGTNLPIGEKPFDPASGLLPGVEPHAAGATEYDDPDIHQPPPTARIGSDASKPEYERLWGPHMHAESDFRHVSGMLNLNTAVDTNTINNLFRHPIVSDASYGRNVKPRYQGDPDPEMKTYGNLGLERYGHGGLAWRIWRMRPFYAPSMIASVYDKAVNDSGGAQASKPLDQWAWANFDPAATQGQIRTVQRDEDGNIINITVHRDRIDQTPRGDAAMEEAFARILNLTTLSSRNFRVYVVGEYLSAPNPNNPSAPQRVLASQKRVYEVFMKPERDLDPGDHTPTDTSIKRVRCEIISERDY